MCDSGSLDEYLADVKVYQIEDGERHLYAAKSAWEALKEHSDLMELLVEIGEVVTLTCLSPEKKIPVRFENEGDLKHFPLGWDREPQESSGWVLTATAGEWAQYYSKVAPQQISSSVF